MRQLQTYNPARLAAAYSPNRPSWPLAVWLTLVVGQAAIAKPQAAKLPAARLMHLGARYLPQAVSGSSEGLLEYDDLREEVRLPALPKRQYQINMRVQQIKKGRLRM